MTDLERVRDALHTARMLLEEHNDTMAVELVDEGEAERIAHLKEDADLLAALEEIATAKEDWTASDTGFSKLQGIADAAIAKAKGES